ncbi:hypothetical protein AcW1_006673 [Taiwanofungus camphoratus]|nr:hypothetical protein AcV7_007398 [Antrodia cinnamomea]KAI0954926.1 hypothetical protein AcW1_006673 [Antrodia cinnamomea]
MSSIKRELEGQRLPSSLSEGIQTHSRHGISRVLRWLLVSFSWFIVIYQLSLTVFALVHDFLGPISQNNEVPLCPQVPALIPEKHGELWQDLGGTFGGQAFLDRAVNWLAGAVRIPTESYDEMLPVGEDPRWEAFGPFHDYLLSAFPQTHATLELTKVNTYGLVYVWTGSDVSLKPLLLTAHQDVVPVNPDTYDDWRYPPYSGHFDGKYIWGRGAVDDKSGLIGIMASVELLLERNFRPTRSLVIAFGIDEESSGTQGGLELGKYLLSKYGENAFAMLVDEGGTIEKQYGGVFALPAIAEKGYLDVQVELTTPGGHSSIPPPHTAIGILAAFLVQYEDNPIQARLSRDTPIYQHVQCLAEYAPDFPASLRKAVKRSVKSDKALVVVQNMLLKIPLFKALVGTTQAIDLINGGVKANALPENAVAVVDHRIAADSSVNAVREHSTAILKPLATRFNLSYVAFGSHVTEEGVPSYGTLTLSDAWNTALEPAPVTPTGPDAVPFQLLAGTIKATYNAHRALQADPITVIPSLGAGNTDTRFYWRLTPHIFRYAHYDESSADDTNGIHTVNEAIVADKFVEMIRFFTTLILNVDEATTL